MQNYRQKPLDERVIAKKNLTMTLAERDRLNEYCRQHHDSANRVIRELIGNFLDKLDEEERSGKKDSKSRSRVV